MTRPETADAVGLSPRDEELVALGAAIASNCIPCIEYHIPQARKVGLGNPEIREAVKIADKVRRVPAAKVLQTAFALLNEEHPADEANATGSCGCRDAEACAGERGSC